MSKKLSSQVEGSFPETHEARTERKCEFFKKLLMCLGHKILETGMDTDDSKIRMMWELPTPTDVTEARSYLGFRNYYWQFIYKTAQVTQLLCHLLQEEDACKKNKAISGMVNVRKALGS